MNKRSTNIFVIGDLVIDHTIFVRDATVTHKGIAGEPIYEVVRRVDTAGGAANNARVLAVLSPGKTFLWGLVGRSNWGSFRSILEKCHAIDEADANVEFRGVQDETQAQMNTITRLIMVDDDPPDYDRPEHKARFDDYGHLHVADDKRLAVIHYLERAHEKHTIDGIIVNDLDMNGLTADIIQRIAKFANGQTPPVPLFIDPKRLGRKYNDIQGTAIMPNLTEWCQLVGQTEPNAPSTWRRFPAAPDAEALAPAPTRLRRRDGRRLRPRILQLRPDARRRPPRLPEGERRGRLLPRHVVAADARPRNGRGGAAADARTSAPARRA
ncbi:MAG: PfkB family carbohydrate kinase [Acidobacteria bacterium]|nr:PfkB family carbohydrate kinase [Acidobacteriota bacterium]